MRCGVVLDGLHALRRQRREHDPGRHLGSSSVRSCGERFYPIGRRPRCGYAGTMRRSLAVSLCLLGGLARARGRARMQPRSRRSSRATCRRARRSAQREPVDVNAQGLTPNGTADGRARRRRDPAPGADRPDGRRSSGSVPAPFQASGQRLVLALDHRQREPVDRRLGASRSSPRSTSACNPANARPSSRVRFRGRGFTGAPGRLRPLPAQGQAAQDRPARDRHRTVRDVRRAAAPTTDQAPAAPAAGWSRSTRSASSARRRAA